MRPSAVEQVFLEPRGGVVEVLLVLEDPAGGRTRERLPLPVADMRTAASQAGRHLASRGIAPARRVRLRVSAGGRLQDDEDLLRVFLDALGS